MAGHWHFYSLLIREWTLLYRGVPSTLPEVVDFEHAGQDVGDEDFSHFVSNFHPDRSVVYVRLWVVVLGFLRLLEGWPAIDFGRHFKLRIKCHHADPSWWGDIHAFVSDVPLDAD